MSHDHKTKGYVILIENNSSPVKAEKRERAKARGFSPFIMLDTTTSTTFEPLLKVSEEEVHSERHGDAMIIDDGSGIWTFFGEHFRIILGNIRGEYCEPPR